MSYQRRTHNRSQRFGGHTKHTFYCSCGRQVVGNGGKQHFKRDGHTRISWDQWRVAAENRRIEQETAAHYHGDER